MKKSYLVIVLLVLAMLACSLATPTPTPEPTVTPTPVIVVVTATPAPINLGEDVIMAPPSDWMDLEILKQFPSAAVWPPAGVEKGVRLYRIFKHNGVTYMAIFGQGKEKWELVDAIEIGSPPTPEPSKYMKDT